MEDRLAHRRYLISIQAVEMGDPGGVVVHDTWNITEQCNLDDIKRADRSQFGDLQWAIGKGYRPCGHCMTSAGALPEETKL